MRISVLFEKSGRVRDAFIKAGHNAISCDLLPSDTKGPHYQGDVKKYWLELGMGSDMVIAFPPCQFLTNSNAWRWDAIKKEREEALELVRWVLNLPCNKICLENPAGAIGTNIRPADQYIDPWMFGEPYQKHTGLWLVGLSKLVPDTVVKPYNVKPWNQGSYKWASAGTGKRKSSDRSLTFNSIANAMAKQWGT